MAKKLFVVNEWLISDLNGENGDEKRAESLEFILLLKKKCDRIAVLAGSPWMQKAYALMSNKDNATRRLSKVLHLAVLRDSNKCSLVYEKECTPVPQFLKDRIHDKDEYLFRLLYAANADILVTTDLRLAEQVAKLQSDKPKISLRDDFLREYRCEEG